MLPRDVELNSSNSATEFYPSLHAKFLYQYLPNNAPSYEQLMSEYLKMSGIYWTTTALQLIGRDFDQDVKRQIIDLIGSCVHPSGGISPSVGHDPHLPHTLSAIQILVSYGALNLDSSSSSSDESVNENESVNESIIDVERTVQWIASLQKEDGSFTGDRWGEVDTRFSFCAIAACALLNRLDAINLDAAVEFVLKCYNDIDGAFACRPNSESQASAIYCCLGTLSIAGQLDRIDADQLGWWLSERQLASGGLNGRPEKLPDLCYSWWVLSSLAIIGRLHWISKRKLLQYILACQDGQSGGFADRPGNMVDPFHTVFGIAGLSLLCHEYLDDLVEEEEVAEAEKQTEYSETINKIDVNAISETVRKVNPIFCMLESVIQRRAIRTQRLSVL